MQYLKKTTLIFDLDGTLIDSVPDITISVANMMQALSAKIPSQDDVRGWVGNGSLKLVERALIWADLPHTPEDINAAHQTFLACYQKNVFNQTKEYPNVGKNLDKLMKAGFCLNIATNKPVEFVPDILKGLGWTDKFQLILGGNSLPVKKPNPLPLLHICEKLGVSTDQAIMIGDSKNDVEAGKNANITTLALTYGYNYDTPISQSNPDGVFDDFDELADFILKTYR